MQPLVVAITTDGLVNLYEFTSHDLRLKKSLKLEALFREYKKRVWSSMKSQEENLDPTMLCIGADLFPLDPGTTIKLENKSIVSPDNEYKLILIYGTTSYLFVIDLDSESLLELYDWKRSQELNKTLFIPHVMSFCLAKDRKISTAVLSIFQNEINIIQIAQVENTKPIEARPAELVLKSHSVLSDDAILTVFPQ